MVSPSRWPWGTVRHTLVVLIRLSTICLLQILPGVLWVLFCEVWEGTSAKVKRDAKKGDGQNNCCN